MKYLRLSLIFGLIALLSVISAARAYSAIGRTGRGGQTPRVRKIRPKDDSQVIIEDKGVEFKWSLVPMPAGGRRTFRFKLFKGFGYGSIVKEELAQDITSITVQAEVFEDGQLYSWEIAQRGSEGWSKSQRWSFTAIKEEK